MLVGYSICFKISFVLSQEQETSALLLVKTLFFETWDFFFFSEVFYSKKLKFQNVKSSRFLRACHYYLSYFFLSENKITLKDIQAIFWNFS